jgi:hypothetical protein
LESHYLTLIVIALSAIIVCVSLIAIRAMLAEDQKSSFKQTKVSPKIATDFTKMIFSKIDALFLEGTPRGGGVVSGDACIYSIVFVVLMFFY